MPRPTVTTLAMAMLIAWFAQVRADDKPAAVSEATGAITGQVVDLKGQPLTGAEVWGIYFNGKAGPTKTGGDGRFRLTGLMPDRPVTVWAEAKNLTRERHDDVHVFPNKDLDIGRITLLPGTKINGRAVDAQGKPLAGAHVKLELYRYQLGHTISSQQTEWTLTAQVDGRFATPPLPAGDANFSIRAQGKTRTSVSKPAQPGTPVIDLGDVALADEIPVSGIVTDTDGKPAPGVEVIPDYDWQNSTKTNQQGQFVVHGVGKNVKQLRLQSNDYFSAKAFDVTPGQADLKLTVIKSYEIHGSAQDAETGKPVKVDSVRLCRVERDPKDGHVSLYG
jgi:hypothetical protein